MSAFVEKSKLLLAFASGALCVALLHVGPLKASTGAPTGTCMLIGNYSTWGWPSSAGSRKEYNEMAQINFDTKRTSVIVNQVQVNAGGEPTYTEGPLEESSFTLSAGPLPGVYKMAFSKASDYALIAPTNGGNTILVLDSITGMTGVCQKV